jgi:hypothetical protein
MTDLSGNRQYDALISDYVLTMTQYTAQRLAESLTTLKGNILIFKKKYGGMLKLCFRQASERPLGSAGFTVLYIIVSFKMK